MGVAESYFESVEKENDYENEERSRAEDWPTEYTEYTERGAEFLTTKHMKDTKVGGRGPECLPANYAKGREWGKRESDEWPTEYTEGGRDPEAEGGKVGVNLICGRGRGGGWRERPLANRRDLN